MRGVRPSHAAKWRADWNRAPSPTAATRAVAVSGRMPGAVARRWLSVAGLVPCEDFLLDLAELLGECVEVLEQNHNGGTRLLGQNVRARLFHGPPEFDETPEALRRDEPELAEQPAYRVDGRCALPHQKRPCAMQRQQALAFLCLDRNETHGRSRHRFADRLCVGGISLVPLHVGLRVSRRDQPYLVTGGAEVTRPVMRARASLHPDQARREPIEEDQQLLPP